MKIQKHVPNVDVHYKKGGLSMPLIKCPGCGNDISDRAEKCIHCGYILGSPKTSEINNDNVSINTGVTNNETIGSGPLIASSSSVS